MSKLFLYTNTKPNNTISTTGTKASYLGIDKDVDIVPGTTVIHPEFLLSGGFDTKKVNYVYCEKFKRFYYVDDIVALSNDMYRLRCTCDVLESFKWEFFGSEFLISRQEHKYNKMIEDPLLVPMVGSYQEVPPIIGNVGKDIKYVLTVAGGAE